MSSLNPFGSSSDEDESDVEPAAPPVPAPCKLKTPPLAEPKVVEEKKVEIMMKEEDPEK